MRFRSFFFQSGQIADESFMHTSLHLVSHLFGFLKSFRTLHMHHNNQWFYKNIKLSGTSGKSRNIVGQNPLLSHTIAIGFSLVLILLVMTTLTSLRDNYQDFIGKNEISQVCSILKDSIGKIFVDDAYTSPTNTTKGRIVVALPRRIADLNYRVRLLNNSFFIETFGTRINDTCKAGFNLTYNGSTTGGLTELIYVKKDNGDNRISVTKM